MSSILQDLEKEIANVTTSVEKTNVGTVREIGDGVAKVEGLSDLPRWPDRNRDEP
jgi:F-type H+-transporting ATPase subunit alpha